MVWPKIAPHLNVTRVCRRKAPNMGIWGAFGCKSASLIHLVIVSFEGFTLYIFPNKHQMVFNTYENHIEV